MNKIILSIYLLSFVLLSPILSIEISLEDYLKKLQSHNPTLEKITFGSSEQKALVKQQYAQWDTHLFFDTSLSKGLSSGFSSSFSADGNSTAVSLGASKDINGSTHSITSAYSATTDLPDSDFVIPDMYQFGLTYTYTKPLLKNFGGKLTKASKDKIELQEQLLSLNLEEDTEEFLYQSIAEYYEWVRLQKRVNLLKLEIKKAKNQYSLTESLFKDNLVEKQDKFRAKKRLLLTEMSYENEKNQLDIQTRLIQSRIGYQQELRPDLRNASLSYKPVLGSQLTMSRPFKMMYLFYQQSEKDIIIAKQNRRKSLDFMAAATAGGLGTDIESMNSDIGDSNQFQVGLSGSFSKEKSAEEAAYQAALDAQTRVNAEREELKRLIAFNFDQMNMIYAQLNKHLLRQQEVITLAQDVESLETEAYKRAQRSSLITIIDTQRELLQDQLQLIDFATQLDLTRLGLLQLTDGLLSHPQVGSL